jgi:multicomponent Na+:H+ antiporter subunit G
VSQIAVVVLAVVGLVFSLTGAVGVVRLPDVYSRIHCTSVFVTMGAVPALLALVIGEGAISQYGVRAVLVGILLLTLSPAVSHALARAAYKSGIPQWDKAVADEPKERR